MLITLKGAPSTISWHLNRLKNGKVVTSASHNGKPQVYKIINRYAVKKMVSKHTRAII